MVRIVAKTLELRNQKGAGVFCFYCFPFFAAADPSSCWAWLQRALLR